MHQMNTVIIVKLQKFVNEEQHQILAVIEFNSYYICANDLIVVSCIIMNTNLEIAATV